MNEAPVNDNGHVEAEDEGDGDEVRKLATVQAHKLKVSLEQNIFRIKIFKHENYTKHLTP